MRPGDIARCNGMLTDIPFIGLTGEMDIGILDIWWYQETVYRDVDVVLLLADVQEQDSVTFRLYRISKIY